MRRINTIYCLCIQFILVYLGVTVQNPSEEAFEIIHLGRLPELCGVFFYELGVPSFCSQSTKQSMVCGSFTVSISPSHRP